MNRLDKIKQEFFEQFQNKLAKEHIELSIESAFDILVSADPSRNKKNVRWLMETYLDDGYLWEDISAGQHSKVYDTLNTFIRNKTKLDILDRSLNRYQSIADMWKMVKQYAEDKTGKEIKREEYDRAMAESEMVIDNDDIRVVVPLTEYAAKFHGRGTRWCTAADNDNMFWDYAEKAPLFVITLKGSGDKLQLWKNGANVQFMDEDDSDVSTDYIEKKWNLLKDMVKYTGALKFTPPEQITPEICKLACKQKGLALGFVPKELRTYEVCKIAVKNNGHALYYVPDMTPDGVLLRTPELYKIACEQDGRTLEDVPDMTIDGLPLKTPELYKIAVENYGLILKNVPEELRTPELCKIAVKNNGYALKYVPDMTADGVSLKTPELCEIACKQNGRALECVPTELRTYELCKLACEQDGSALFYVPDELRTPELCKLACEQDGLALMLVPDMTSEGLSLRTPELYKIACEQDGMALRFISDELKTYELCKTACEQNGRALKYVPEKYKSYQLCEIAVQQNEQALSFIPEKDITPELSELAKKQGIETKSISIPTDIYKQEINRFKEMLMPSIEPSQTIHHTM